MKEKTLTLEDIIKAQQRIKDYIVNTPLTESVYLSDDKKKVYFKLESSQEVKAFKIRGAFNKILNLNEDDKKRGLAAISSGNHGVSISYVAHKLKLSPPTIIVPKNVSPAKVEKIKYYGAKVLLLGENYDEAHTLGEKYIKEHNLLEIDSWYNDEEVYAGQGTIFLEIYEKLKDVDTILIPIGGGGLLTGIMVCAKTLNPNIKVYGVQTESCPAMLMSLKNDICYDKYETKESVCESLIGGVGILAFNYAKKLIDDVLLVSEEEIKLATAYMGLKEQIIVEPSSATVVAAYQKYKNFMGNKTVLVISGANPNPQLILDIFNEYKESFL